MTLGDFISKYGLYEAYPGEFRSGDVYIEAGTFNFIGESVDFSEDDIPDTFQLVQKSDGLAIWESDELNSIINYSMGILSVSKRR